MPLHKSNGIKWRFSCIKMHYSIAMSNNSNGDTRKEKKKWLRKVNCSKGQPQYPEIPNQISPLWKDNVQWFKTNVLNVCWDLELKWLKIINPSIPIYNSTLTNSHKSKKLVNLVKHNNSNTILLISLNPSFHHNYLKTSIPKALLEKR